MRRTPTREASDRRRLPSVLLLVLGLGVPSAMAQVAARPAGPGDPRSPWLEYARAEDAGFSTAKLEAARAFADSLRSGAVFAVYKGRVFAAFGAVDRAFMAHSVRKSLAGALYGIAIAEKRLSLDATVAELGIDDEPPLTEGEKQARFRDLIAARSGIYHTAAYAASDQDDTRPARGSHAPGTFWFYNNWDFNAAETIYHRATGTDVFEAFAAKVAGPIGMEDYSAADGFLAFEPSLSKLPAHTFRISARDLARFGQLYLQEGMWGNRQVVPRDWVKESLRQHSDFGGGQGYGYLWWTYAPGSLGERYPLLNTQTISVARGTGGQALFVIPGLDMVVVHRGDTDHGRNVGGPQIWTLVEQLAAARDGGHSLAPPDEGGAAREPVASAPRPDVRCARSRQRATPGRRVRHDGRRQRADPSVHRRAAPLHVLSGPWRGPDVRPLATRVHDQGGPRRDADLHRGRRPRSRRACRPRAAGVRGTAEAVTTGPPGGRPDPP